MKSVQGNGTVSPRAIEALDRTQQVQPASPRIEQALRAPETVRIPVTSLPSPRADQRAQSSQIETLRQQGESSRSKGKRQKFLKTEDVQVLSRAERKGWSELAATLGESPVRREAVADLVRAGLEVARRPKARDMAAAFERAGLEQLLVETFGRGKLTTGAVQAELARLGEALRSKSLQPDEVKNAILVFDGAAQRLAVADGGQRFTYATGQNHARDLLITFARALHR